MQARPGEYQLSIFEFRGGDAREQWPGTRPSPRERSRFACSRQSGFSGRGFEWSSWRCRAWRSKARRDDRGLRASR